MGDGAESTLLADKKTVAAAEKAVKRPWVITFARLGFVSKGVLFIVIGALAFMVMTGSRGAALADPRSALGVLFSGSYGTPALIVFALGAVGHGVWNILRGGADVDNVGGNWFAIVKRGIAVGLGVFYLGLAVTALEIVFISGAAAASSQAEETLVWVLLSVPILGDTIAIIIGLCLAGAGVHEAYAGLSGKFTENYRHWEITGLTLVLARILGIASFPVRAVLLVVLGYFFVRAPFRNGVGQIGIDESLLTILRASYGVFAVAIAGAGLICHGLLAFFEARFRKIS